MSCLSSGSVQFSCILVMAFHIANYLNEMGDCRISSLFHSVCFFGVDYSGFFVCFTIVIQYCLLLLLHASFGGYLLCATEDLAVSKRLVPKRRQTSST